MPVTPARRFAYEVLLRVERDAAFASEVLNAGGRNDAGQGKLDIRDQALATEIALGCLRRQGEIDHMIAAAGKRPVAKLDPEVRAALRIGCYQLRFLDRIPDRAAVSESVELVKSARKRSAAGFVNAVLRHLPPVLDTQGAAQNYPPWMVERWRKNFGPDLARGIIESGLTTPPTYLRLNPRFDADETVQLLREEGVETEAAEFPLARKATSGRPQLTRGFAERRFRIQDIGSQAVVPQLELSPGMTFLDLCAAPGGKSFQAIETLGSAQNVISADRYVHRLRIMRDLATPSTQTPAWSDPGRDAPNLVALDAGQPLPFRRKFDRILVDAPCSGTGTLARNPEIKWRLKPPDLAELAARQRAILARALDQLAADGLLVYATCSLEPEENQQVVKEVLEEKTSFAARAYFQRVPGREAGDGFYACQIRPTAAARTMTNRERRDGNRCPACGVRPQACRLATHREEWRAGTETRTAETELPSPEHEPCAKTSAALPISL